MKKELTTCLWFDNQAEAAAEFYTSIFRDSKIENINRYGSEGHEIHGREKDSVMMVNFTLNGQKFCALNGGPVFSFSEAVSFQIFCDDQEEIDHYWYKLTEGGEESQCGWLKDKFGLSWQVVPTILSTLMQDPERAERVTRAFLKMKKMEIEKLITA